MNASLQDILLQLSISLDIGLCLNKAVHYISRFYPLQIKLNTNGLLLSIQNDNYDVLEYSLTDLRNNLIEIKIDNDIQQVELKKLNKLFVQ